MVRDHVESKALISLAVLYAYAVGNILNFTTRSSVEVENDFTAVERLMHYENILTSNNKNPNDVTNENIKCEKDFINENYRPSEHWPNEGNIKIENLRLKYRENLDYVLKGINIEIHQNEKIGIVGRTGSGKSSLLIALFRLIEPESDSKISIDNIDCLQLGLRDLRSNLSIIPQDAVLFSGTLRFNFDPFNQYTDEQIWDVIAKVELLETVKQKANALNLSNSLLLAIDEHGSNFSHGQKQLICIGRTLLKNSKILMLDEATSSIDKHTDTLIQQLIRHHFKYCTVLCIAHRIETILDYDKILVLRDGNVVEFDKPNVLLADKNSLFYSMVSQMHNEKD